MTPDPSNRRRSDTASLAYTGPRLGERLLHAGGLPHDASAERRASLGQQRLSSHLTPPSIHGGSLWESSPWAAVDTTASSIVPQRLVQAMSAATPATTPNRNALESQLLATTEGRRAAPPPEPPCLPNMHNQDQAVLSSLPPPPVGPASAVVPLGNGNPPAPLGSRTSMNNLSGNRRRRSSLALSLETIVVRTSIPGRPRNTVEQQRRALSSIKRFQRCVRILMNTFRWFALFDQYSFNVAQNSGRSALSAQQSMGSGALIRKSGSTASGGDSGSPSATSGYINSAALFRPVLSDYAASRAMFAVPPALRHVLTSIPRTQRTESDIHLIFKYLENVNGLKSCSQSVIKELATVVEHEFVRPGRVVLKQGHQPQSMYVIVRGTCDVFRTESLAPGRYWRRVLRPLAAGDLFGDLGVKTGAPRSASIVPTTECELLRIDKADYDRILDRQVALANQIKLHFLAQSPVGRHMTEEERQALAHLGVVHEYARGKVIVHEGEQVKDVLAVRSGTVRVVKFIEFWHQRVDILPHGAPIDGKSIVEHLPVSRRTALAVPKYIRWHRRADNAHCYRQERGDKIEGEFLVVGELHAGDFAEEQTILITPQSPSEISKQALRNVASRHVVDANAVFYAKSTYIADEPCEIVQFPNVQFLKLVSDETLTAMQTIVNMRPTVEVQVNEYLRHRAYGKVKEKVVTEEVLGRRDREKAGQFFAMETRHLRTSAVAHTAKGKANQTL